MAILANNFFTGRVYLPYPSSNLKFAVDFRCSNAVLLGKIHIMNFFLLQRGLKPPGQI